MKLSKTTASTSTPHRPEPVNLSWKQYFEAPFLEKRVDGNRKEIVHKNWTYVCKLCKAAGNNVTANGEFMFRKCHDKTTSALVDYMRTVANSVEIQLPREGSLKTSLVAYRNRTDMLTDIIINSIIILD